MKLMQASSGLMRLLLWLALCGDVSFSWAADLPPQVAQAKDLLDTYYGDRANIRTARELLKDAFDGSSKDADAYVQAARAFIMIADMSSPQATLDSARTYHALLDKALAIDPRSAKAYILKAEAFHLERAYPQELQSLEKAKELGSTDPWLWVGLGRYYETLGDTTAAYHSYRQATEIRPIASNEDRRGYVKAAYEMATFNPPQGGPSRQELGGMVWRERHPKDAWVLGDFAGLYVYHGMFDDAIRYAKEARKTMDYGMVRAVLAAALYGKAAELITDGNEAEAKRYAAEADTFGFGKPAVFRNYRMANEKIMRLMPTLQEIVPQ